MSTEISWSSSASSRMDPSCDDRALIEENHDDALIEEHDAIMLEFFGQKDASSNLKIKYPDGLISTPAEGDFSDEAWDEMTSSHEPERTSDVASLSEATTSEIRKALATLCRKRMMDEFGIKFIDPAEIAVTTVYLDDREWKEIEKPDDFDSEDW